MRLTGESDDPFPAGTEVIVKPMLRMFGYEFCKGIVVCADSRAGRLERLAYRVRIFRTPNRYGAFALWRRGELALTTQQLLLDKFGIALEVPDECRDG